MSPRTKDLLEMSMIAVKESHPRNAVTKYQMLKECICTNDSLPWKRSYDPRVIDARISSVTF